MYDNDVPMFSEPRPCAGFDESLVLAVKDCFLESDMREILIGRIGVGVMFFSRQCTSLATDKKVCTNCDHWFTQISRQNKQKSVFGIDNFLDNHLDVDKENSDEGKKAARKKYLKSKSRHAKCQEADGVTGSKAVCEQCGALVSSNNMKQHVRRAHSNHNNLSCEHCDKQFKYRSELLVHLTHHTGELNYSCSACGKKFRRAGEVRERRWRPGLDTKYCRPGCVRRDTEDCITLCAIFVSTEHTRSE